MKHNFDEVLKNFTDSRGIKTLHAYDVEIEQQFHNDHGCTVDITFRCDVDRRSGKTTRRILRAIIEASEGKSVFFFTRKMDLAELGAVQMRAVLERMHVEAAFFTDRIDIKGGGAIRCMSKEFFDSRSRELTCGLKNIVYIEDLN